MKSYAKYTAYISEEPDTYGSMTTKNEASDIADRLVEMIEAKYPDIVCKIKYRSSWLPRVVGKDGENDSVAGEIDLWIDANWLKAVQYVLEKNMLTDDNKAEIAAEFIGGEWNEWLGKCIYTDSEFHEDYICNSLEEMVDLYELITSPNSVTRRDAYRIWQTRVSHGIA
jgi:hypothetical protein